MSRQSDAPVTGQSPEQPPELDRLGRRRHAGQFKPGQSGNPSGLPKPRPDEDDEGFEDDGATTLARMKRVFIQPEGRDRGPAERTLRKLLRTDPKGYLAQMVAFERAEAGKAEAATAVNNEPPPDETTADLLALIDDLLDRHGAKPKE